MSTRQEGFTIAEVVISMVLLSIILVTLGGLTYTSAQRALTATASAQRQAYAMETVNRLTTLPFANLAGAAGCDSVGSPNMRFQRCITVTTAGNAATITLVTTPVNQKAVGTSTLRFYRANTAATNPLCSGC